MDSPVAPIAALAPQAGAAAPGEGATELAVAQAVPKASPAEAAEFAQAVSADVRLPAPSTATALGQDLSQRMQSLSDYLQGWQGAAAAPGTAGAAPDPVEQLHAAFTFAIQTMLASRGSTEATKIFNTLLKGQ